MAIVQSCISFLYPCMPFEYPVQLHGPLDFLDEVLHWSVLFDCVFLVSMLWCNSNSMIGQPSFPIKLCSESFSAVILACFYNWIYHPDSELVHCGIKFHFQIAEEIILCRLCSWFHPVGKDTLCRTKHCVLHHCLLFEKLNIISKISLGNIWRNETPVAGGFSHGVEQEARETAISINWW